MISIASLPRGPPARHAAGRRHLHCQAAEKIGAHGRGVAGGDGGFLVVTLGGPTMFARIGVMRALNRHVVRMFDPSRNNKHWSQRKLARDR